MLWSIHNVILSDSKISFDELKQHLFKAADILRKRLDASENRKPVLTLLFLKRLNDIFEENVEDLMKTQGLTKKEAEHKRRHPIFYLPEDTRWSAVQDASEDVGGTIIQICKKIEDANPKKLGGTMTYAEFNIKEKYPDTSLIKLIDHFSETEEGPFRLRDSDLENEDVFGDAYEYLLEMFASETKKKGGQFYTPRQVVRLLVELTEPKYDFRINDPTCGSGGMLIHSRSFVENTLQKEGKSKDKIDDLMKNMTLHGQDSNIDTVNMCKMNMVIHGVPSFKIEWEDVLETPKFVENGELIKYDRVLANFPFGEDWEDDGKENDPYQRFKYGIPPGSDRADFAFVQHMLSSLKDDGQAAIVCSQGILFRGGNEKEIRKNMILGKDGLQGDVIEAVIALPPALFFGTPIPGCILVLNKNKPEKRKNKIIFIYAAHEGEFQEGKVRNQLRDKDIKKIAKQFKEFKNVDRYCYVANLEDLEENEYSLNVPRYVDVFEPEEKINIKETMKKITKNYDEQEKLKKIIETDLKELNLKFE